MDNKELEERLRALELGYTKIESQIVAIAADIKDTKDTLKELAEIAKQQIRTDTVLTGFGQDIVNLSKRVDKIEQSVSWLTKVVYGALLIASIIAPVIIELLKRKLLK